jgi:hypothetical protein
MPERPIVTYTAHAPGARSVLAAAVCVSSYGATRAIRSAVAATRTFNDIATKVAVDMS